MPKYKDNVTGQVKEFDHEPSEQELQQSFGLPPGAASPSMGGPKPYDAEAEKSAVAPGLGGMLGAVIGGKTPLGKVGSGIGAAAGTAYGDLYNMISHGVGDTTPTSEAKRLATVGGLTSAAETVLPPFLRGVGKIKEMLPQGSGLLGGGGMGWLFGHPGYGAAAGAAIEAAPKVAAGIDYLGAPAGTGAGKAAEDSFLAGVPPKFANNPQMQAQATKAGDAARVKAAGPMGEVPDYLKQENWGDSLRSAGGYVKNKANAAIEGLQGMFGSVPSTPPPTAPASPLTRTKSVGDIAERAGVTGQPVSSLPDASRNPNLKWNAEVSAVPQRTPQLSQTSPTDPTMPWDEHMARSAPKRTSTGGSSFAEVTDAAGNPYPKGWAPQDRASSAAMQGLTESAPSVGTHDEGLQRWVEGGGTPESYARTKALNAPDTSHGFGPNTVGAAEKAKFLPKTVDEAKGMSLAEQEAWEGYKRANPGVTDGMLNSWYTNQQMGADPNEGLDIDSMVQKLTDLLKRQ